MSEAKLKELERELGRINTMLDGLEREKADIEKALKHDSSPSLKEELEDTKQKIGIVTMNLNTTNKKKKKLEEKMKKDQKGGKGTRRKHRSGKKWTSSATRKRSSMSASKGRRGMK